MFSSFNFPITYDLSPRSNTGFVNVYGSDSFARPSPLSGFDTSPKPAKQIANLTTPISTVRFNHDAQLMAIASREKKDAMRLVSVVSPSVLLSGFGSSFHFHR